MKDLMERSYLAAELEWQDDPSSNSIDLADYGDIVYWNSDYVLQENVVEAIAERELKQEVGNYSCNSFNQELFVHHNPSINFLLTTNLDYMQSNQPTTITMPQLPVRVIVWEKLKISAPGGDLQSLFRCRPCELWRMVLSINPSYHSQMKYKLRSCLNEIYIGYLKEAEAKCLLSKEASNELKRQWMASSDWKQLCGSNGQDHDLLVSTDSKKWDYGRLTSGKQDEHLPSNNHAYRYAAPQQQVQIPTFGAQSIGRPVMDEAGAFQELSGMLGSLPTTNQQWQTPSNDRTAYIRDMLRSVSHASSVYAATGTKRDLDSDGNGDRGKKRKVEQLDHDSNAQDAYFAFSHFGNTQLPTPKSGMSTSNQDSGTTSPGLPYSSNVSNLSLLLEAHQGSLAIEQSRQPLSTPITSRSVPAKVPHSSLPNLSEEAAASLWLDYNLRSVLESHPPRAPRDPSAKHAVERALPYLLSIKTKLSFLKIMHSNDGQVVRELDSAMLDIDTAWEYLHFVKPEQYMPSEAVDTALVCDNGQPTRFA